MSTYKLADILAQEIPDQLMLDIALHLQANDNRSQNHSTSCSPGCSMSGRKAVERPGRRVHDHDERLEALWIWCRAVTASFMIDLCLAGALDGQPG